LDNPIITKNLASATQGDLRREEQVALAVNETSVIDLVSGYETPFEGWNSLQVRQRTRLEYENWLINLANWSCFVTLTFKDEKQPDVAKALFNWFVRFNNVHLLGKHYTKFVGHSYFSYICAMELQKRDVLHFHVLVDKPLDFSYVHKIWGERCGFVWIDGHIKSQAQTISYLCKYLLKGGEVDVYKAKNSGFTPIVEPVWWNT